MILNPDLFWTTIAIVVIWGLFLIMIALKEYGAAILWLIPCIFFTVLMVVIFQTEMAGVVLYMTAFGIITGKLVDMKIKGRLE